MGVRACGFAAAQPARPNPTIAATVTANRDETALKTTSVPPEIPQAVNARLCMLRAVRNVAQFLAPSRVGFGVFRHTVTDRAFADLLPYRLFLVFKKT